MERPEVTVVDPARPDPPEPSPSPADQQQPRGWATSAVAAVAALVLGAGALVGLDGRADRRAGAGAARLVALEATTVGFREQAFVDGARGTVDVSVYLAVRNAGRDPVPLVGASLGVLTATTDEVLEPGRTVVVQLRALRSCPRAGGAEPSPDDLGAGLVARVSDAASVRSVPVESSALALGRLARITVRACGFLPIEEAVRVSGSVTAVRDGAARVRLEVDNASVRRVRLQSLALGPGLSVRSAGGAPLALPLDLAAAPLGEVITTAFDVEVAVACGARLVDGLAEVAAVVDDGGQVRVGPLRGFVRHTDLLRQLAARTCASGSRAS